MAHPKRKTSKSRLRTRKHAHKVTAPESSSCPNCGQLRQSHRVCTSCGFYKGRQVVSIKTT